MIYNTGPVTAFIVISLDGRLSQIVEDIAERCLPQNPDAKTYVSTGCIKRSDQGYTYHYTVYNHGEKKSKEGHSLSDLLKNQAAGFRAVHSTTGQIKVFVLQNPMTSEEYEADKDWMKALEALYGTDRNLFFFHILFTYDLTCPDDVNKQMPKEIVKQCIDDRNNYSFRDNSRLMYFSNHTLGAAALCLDEEEHSLKLPRILADFMMLASSDSTAGDVMTSISNNGGNGTGIFSLGYAESMYYYPDVERYYEHASKRDMFEYILTCNDETAAAPAVGDDSVAMDVEKYPFGLEERIRRLEKYTDIPFSEDISRYPPQYADKIIDDCLGKLKSSLEKERKQEKDDFEQSLAGMTNADKSEELKSFSPSCPEFTDRDKIFHKYCGINNVQDKKNYLDEAVKQYEDLVKFALDEKFRTFLQGKAVVSPANNGNAPSVSETGSLLSLPTLLKRIFRGHTGKEPVVNNVLAPVEEIANMQRLKEEYKKFKGKVDGIEIDNKKEKDYCGNYKLTTHLHSSTLLIEEARLRQSQKNDWASMLDEVKKQWQGLKCYDKSISKLLESVVDEAKEKCRRGYRRVDWTNPFSFVRKVDDKTLVEICKDMHKKSAPFVNCKNTQNNSINFSIYSDMRYSDMSATFAQRVNSNKNHLTVGNQLSAYYSTCIESKICMFQFLPLSQAVLDDLTE